MFVYLTIISRIETIVLILQVLVPGSYYSTLGKPPAFSSSGYETNSKSERKNCLFLQKGILEESGQKICRAWIQVTSRSFLLTVSLLLSPLDHRIWNPRIQFCKYQSPAWFIASPVGGSIDPRLFIWPSLGSCCSNWGCSHDPTVDITYHKFVCLNSHTRDWPSIFCFYHNIPNATINLNYRDGLFWSHCILSAKNNSSVFVKFTSMKYKCRW